MRGAKEYAGYFKLHHKEDKLYCEILPHQFNTPWLCSISVARGGGLGGWMMNFNEEWVLSFRLPNSRDLPHQCHIPVCRVSDSVVAYYLQL